jgi:hypothetical protein
MEKPEGVHDLEACALEGLLRDLALDAGRIERDALVRSIEHGLEQLLRLGLFGRGGRELVGGLGEGCLRRRDVDALRGGGLGDEGEPLDTLLEPRLDAVELRRAPEKGPLDALLEPIPPGPRPCRRPCRTPCRRRCRRLGRRRRPPRLLTVPRGP